MGKAAELIQTKRPRDYDQAVSLLRDLQALADRQESSAAFRTRFLLLRALHQRKPSLLDRFDRPACPADMPPCRQDLGDSREGPDNDAVAAICASLPHETRLWLTSRALGTGALPAPCDKDGAKPGKPDTSRGLFADRGSLPAESAG